ncbi:MAG: ATP-binding protein [Bacteroidota bacterium]
MSSLISRKRFTVKISDRGIGFPLNKQPYIFEKFSLSSRSGTSGEQSNRLGLLFAKSCIERLKGKIWLESAERMGTTFSIEFPA